MWKDWFFFSRSQKIGILTLLIIILALLAAKVTLSVWPGSPTTKDNFESEARIFLDSLKKVPPKNYTKTYYNHYANNKTGATYEKLPIPVLSRFNPNTADSVQFVKLGIRPKIASNILKYRRKGGKFRKAEDFGKIWGINKEQMQKLLSCVDIPAEVTPTQLTVPARIAKPTISSNSTVPIRYSYSR